MSERMSVVGDDSVVMLRHNKVTLALRTLRSGAGRPLLLLHGLGDRSPVSVPSWLAAWSGPVTALDFTGHGASTLPVGGGYSAEILLADADTALAHLGEATVLGRGLGAYIALMLAGGRPGAVCGAILCDGPGLSGGSVGPSTPGYFALPNSSRTPDVYALYELTRDVRPPDYATQFVRVAVEHSVLDTPISVCANIRPPWLAAVVAEAGVAESSIDEALRRYSPPERA